MFFFTREEAMAYLRDDEAAAEYTKLAKKLEVVKAELVTVRNNVFEAMALYRKRRSIETRMAELKENCHLLQR